MVERFCERVQRKRACAGMEAHTSTIYVKTEENLTLTDPKYCGDRVLPMFAMLIVGCHAFLCPCGEM